jgi:hypothetical protein
MKKLIYKWTQKKISLERRRRQTERLIKKADQALKKNNIELWDAYENCIEHQQNKMIELIKEMMQLKEVIENIENHGGKI